MDKEINNSKGEKGFHKKYPNLGEMVPCRLPVKFKPILDILLPLFDKVSGANKQKYVKLLDSIEKDLIKILKEEGIM
jgi:hypothetical protein